MTFDEVVFPIYVLDEEAYIHEEDGVVWAEGKVLDNKNVNYDTLGMRRLKSPLTDLYPLKRGLYELEDLLRYSSPPKFIDSTGRIGQYQRSIYMPLKCHRVRRIALMGEYSLVRIEGVNWPAKERRPPPYSWAAVLYKNNVPWKVLDYFALPFQETRRKI